MATLEVFQDVGEEVFSCFKIKPKNTVDDMICPSFVGWIEIPWFSRRLERPHNYARGIGPQE